jgi:hypothetical protein
MIEDLETPDDLLAYVANRRGQRIAEKRRTFGTLVKPLPSDAQDPLVSQPLVLETDQLRGAVWRLGAREFKMRAYVSAIKHGKKVLKRASEIAQERGSEGSQHAVKPDEPVFVTPVYEWEKTGNPFLTIIVSRMLFIEVEAFWSGKKIPKTFKPIQKHLQSVLDDLSQ